jgi:hypothetical protein
MTGEIQLESNEPITRRTFYKTVGRLGIGIAAATALGVGVPAVAAATTGFRWCSRCQSLWFIGGGNNGHCPVSHLWDHSHYQNGSGRYVLRRDVEWGVGQHGWHWCKNCKAIYFLGNGERGFGRCPNNPSGLTSHTQGDLEISPDGEAWVSFLMETEELNNGPGAQPGWRFCWKCNVLFFQLNGLPNTHCPAGGQHDPSRSLRYLMRFE